MNVIINYLSDITSNSLYKILENELEKISTRDVKIQGLDYLEIFLKDDKSNFKRIINTPKAIKNTTDEETISGILSLNGIPSDLSRIDSVTRTYEVLICDLKILSIRLTIHSKPKQQVKYIREIENAKVSDMAKKALYLMGLDIGMVSVVMTSKRRLKVRAIDPSPTIRRNKDLNALAKMIVDFFNSDENLKSKEIKLGADPEFMLFNAKNGKMIAASEFFPRDGLVGCDNIRIPNRQQRPIAEIRPRPDDSPLELIKNIKHALTSASRLAPYKNVKWVAGSQPINGYSIGGHIHFSNIKINGTLLRALDNYLGIPVFLIEEPNTAAKRRKKYGYLADYRVKDYGGFEYRTPGSWLVSQSIATAILCLAKVVASRYLYLPKNYLNSLEAQKAFYSGDQDYFIKYFYSIWNHIENTDLYSEYAEQLKVFPEMILSRTRWDEKSDFRKSWEINLSNKSYSGNRSSTSTSQPINTNTNTSQVNNRSTSTRTTRVNISNTISFSSNTVRVISSTNSNRRSNNINRGRIIGSGQVRRNQRVR